MKIILDNIIFSLQSSGGISVYWSQLLPYLNQQFNNLEIYQAENQRIRQNALAMALTGQINTYRESTIPLKILRYLSFQKKINANQKVLFHSSYYRILPGAVNIVTVHDFIYEYYRRGLAQKVHHWQKQRAINNASGIICVSAHTKRDLLDFFPDCRVPIAVIPLGKSSEFKVLGKNYCYDPLLTQLINRKFVLYVGERKFYKNFNLMISQLRKNDHLVIVGGAALSAPERQWLKNHWGGSYQHLIRPDNRQLNELFNLAFCFIYPSDYEGFGLPVLEAMAAGCPVICQRTASLIDVAGDAAIYFKRDTHGDLARCLRLLDNTRIRAQAIQKGLQQAQQFSWARCVKQTCDFYRQIYQNS